MTQYKGYFIDNVIFHNTEEIDRFLEQQALERYKRACENFASHSTLEASIYCDEQAEYLVENFGYTWEQLEEIEISVLKAVA